MFTLNISKSMYLSNFERSYFSDEREAAMMLGTEGSTGAVSATN